MFHKIKLSYQPGMEGEGPYKMLNEVLTVFDQKTRESARWWEEALWIFGRTFLASGVASARILRQE